MQEDEPGLVRDAQAGDHDALRELLARYVPLVYNLVGRSVSRPADVDDVTQEVLLRVVRDLSGLESPASFRSWLVTITVHQIGDHFRRPVTEVPAPVSDDWLADVGGRGEISLEFEDLAVLWLDLKGQHRDLVRAGQWLDEEHRALLALWWEECAGRITRTEIAAALDLGEAHTAVRLQRMREQLEQCRVAVVALERRPLCDGLAAVVTDWDGDPNTLWRKRITKHVRTCVVCLREAEHQVPTSRLIAGLQLLPLPAALIAALVEKGLLTAEQWEDAELVAASTAGPDDPDDPRHDLPEDHTAWSTVRWAGRVATVTTAATLLLFVGGFLYDVSQTPPVRQEVPRDTSAVSAALSTISPTPAPVATSAATSVGPTPEPTRTSPRKKAVATDRCARTGVPDAVWAGWTMPNSGEGLPNQHRYTVRQDGTVVDEVTCLVWQRSSAANSYTYAGAQSYCKNLKLAGGNWSVPTRVELTSLIDTTRSGPAIDTKAFPDTPVAFFWTSSPWATEHDPAFAWIVNFFEGLTSNAADQSGKFAVRCVQSPAGSGAVKYTIADGQVKDPMTGLVWQRASSSSMAAPKASAYCSNLALGGKKWRLPGVQELATLVDESLVGPAINRKAFPDTPARGWYWAANRAAPEKDSHWALNYDDGYSNYRDLTSGVVRCVRSS
ncbi:sigma-70 family RNA polymerase sigma factor [Kineosporia sp. NBRC 101731]|uniref:sigma-70 family RNA polymerase sigma factor n=1 Tax=Kineosporia sp. NBRC 101731 TaxID=3032199 RepID=UPI0024A5B946|nr:sigma-70 family RNA polymerase sigma factor [Kineosporia sp. NBRC 101731]GLY33224.1 hypothetical protein Kisp02_65890 [Kineosporia sp. NBRC 101731]